MMPSDPIQAMEFAQSKGQAHKEGRTDVTLKDVAGLDATVGRLQQVVTYLKDPAGTQFRGLARPPKGILLEGDPGVGKTLIAKAIAGEAGVPFFQVCCSSWHAADIMQCCSQRPGIACCCSVEPLHLHLLSAHSMLAFLSVA